jgi:hypothetical protein
MIYSGGIDFIRALSFDAGWWSVGAWVAVAVAFAVTTALLAARGSEAMAAGLLAAGPIASIALFVLLKAVADPTPGCTYECIGRLLLLGPCLGLPVGWSLGLVVGLLWRRTGVAKKRGLIR